MKVLSERAREKRKLPTLAESSFRKFLQRSKIIFKTQRPVGFYIVDFLLDKKKLIVEVDGASHLLREAYDKKRETYLKEVWGFNVFRLSNDDVFNNNFEEFLAYYNELPFIEEKDKSKRLGKGFF